MLLATGPASRVLTAVLALALVAATTVLASVLAASTVHACSCAGQVPAADLVGERELAFVGTAGVGREVEPGVLEHDVAVELAVKGEVPRIVQVRAGTFDGSCGVAVPTGRPMGFVPSAISPTGRSDGWSVDLCSGLVPPGELRAVVGAELPAPTGVGPVSALLIARAGPAEAVAVAVDGRPAGWVDVPGSGFVEVLGAASCPGGRVGVILTATFDASGGPVATRVHLIDLATLDVDERALAETEPVPFGPWSIAGTSCLDDDGTTAVLVDGDGDGRADDLEQIGASGRSGEDLGGRPTAIEGTRLVQLVDGTLQLRDLTSTAPPIDLFTLDPGRSVSEVDLFGDELYLTWAPGDEATLVERRSLDGHVLGSWRITDLDVRRVTVGRAGVLLWDGNTGRQRLLPQEADPIDLGGDFGGVLLGDGVLTWSFDGSPQFRFADGSVDPSWSFLGAGGIRFAVPLQATVSVDPASPAAGPLPLVAVPGAIVAAEPGDTSSTATASTVTTVTTVTPAAGPDAPAADTPSGGARSERPGWATALLAVGALAAVGAVAVGGGRAVRARRRAHSGG